MNEKTTTTTTATMVIGELMHRGGIDYEHDGAGGFFLRSDEMLILVREPKRTSQNHIKELGKILGSTLHGGPGTKLLNAVKVRPIAGTAGRALVSDDPRLWLLVMWLVGYYSAEDPDAEVWYIHNLGPRVQQALTGSTIELAIGAPAEVSDEMHRELKEAGERMAAAA